MPESGQPPQGVVIVGPPEPVSPHNLSLHEAGKQLIVDSISVGRDFCRFMVGVSTGAIPLYLALLQLALPKEYRPDLELGLAAIAPAVGFLAAATVFALGVFPRASTFSLDVPAEIETARTAAIKRRSRMAAIGFALFVISTLAAGVAAIGALRVEAPAAPAQPMEIRLVK